MSDQFFWYVTRAAALITWLSASLSMLVGLATSSRLLGRRPTIPWLVDLHRMLAAMSVVFLAIHMGSLWLDTFVKFGPAELLIPWVATVPGLTDTSLALGVISAWMLIAVQASSLIRDRMPKNVWHTIHLLSFGSLIIGTIHALQTGSDIDNPLVVGVGVSLLTAIVLSSAVRLVRLRSSDRYRDADQGYEGYEGVAVARRGTASVPASRPGSLTDYPASARPGGTRPRSPGQPRQ